MTELKTDADTVKRLSVELKQLIQERGLTIPVRALLSIVNEYALYEPDEIRRGMWNHIADALTSTKLWTDGIERNLENERLRKERGY